MAETVVKFINVWKSFLNYISCKLLHFCQDFAMYFFYRSMQELLCSLKIQCRLFQSVNELNTNNGILTNINADLMFAVMDYSLSKFKVW